MTTPRGPFYAPAISPAQERLRRAVENDEPETQPLQDSFEGTLRSFAQTIAAPEQALGGLALRGLQLASRPFQAAGELAGQVLFPATPPPSPGQYQDVGGPFNPGRFEGEPPAPPAPQRSLRTQLGNLITQFEARPAAEQNLLSLPFGAFAAPGVTAEEAAYPFAAAMRGVQAAPRVAAQAAVNVPLRPVQEAGLRLAGVEPIAGAAEEPLDTLASFDRAIKRSEAAAKTLRESGVPQSASASLQDHIQGLRDMREGHLQARLSPEDYARYQQLQSHLGELQAIQESRVGAGGNKAPNFGSPERVEYDELRALRRTQGYNFPSSAARKAAARRDLLETQRQIADLEQQVDAAPAARAAPTLPGGQIQAGMGIGERPQQGTLLGEFQGKETPSVPLIDQERIQAQQARAAEVAKGQGELPGVAATPEEILPTPAFGIVPMKVPLEQMVADDVRMMNRGFKTQLRLFHSTEAPEQGPLLLSGSDQSGRVVRVQGDAEVIRGELERIREEVFAQETQAAAKTAPAPAAVPQGAGEIWGTLPVPERVQIATDNGLPGVTGSKGWGAMTEAEQKAVARDLQERTIHPLAPKPAEAPVAAEGPIAEFNTAQTGQPFTGRLFRGFGRQDVSSVYDPHFAQENIFGPATYTTPKEEFARNFGPQLESVDVKLTNPLVITNDKEWLAITRRAGMKSSVPLDNAEIQRLRQALQGYDGVIIRVPESEMIGKRLQQAFGDDTVVDFKQIRATPPVAAEPSPGATLEGGAGAPPAQGLPPATERPPAPTPLAAGQAPPPAPAAAVLPPRRTALGLTEDEAARLRELGALRPSRRTAAQQAEFNALADKNIQAAAPELAGMKRLPPAPPPVQATFGETATNEERQRFQRLVDEALGKEAPPSPPAKRGAALPPRPTPVQQVRESLQQEVKTQANGKGLPPPEIPAAIAGGPGGNGGVPGALGQAAFGSQSPVARGDALRLYEGAKTMGNVTAQRFYQEANALLRLDAKAAGIQGLGTRGGELYVPEEIGKPLLLALNGEGKVPAGFERYVAFVRNFRDQTTADAIAADPSFKEKMITGEYFQRLFKQPAAEVKQSPFGGSVGGTPGFLKPREFPTLQAALDAGQQPVSWNPASIAAIRSRAGVEARESMVLVDRLKASHLALPAGEAPAEWRVPQVGPAFEGKPGQERLFTPPGIADRIEAIYGKQPELRVGDVNLLKPLAQFNSVTKQAKMLASLFEHVEFAAKRVPQSSMRVGSLLHGAPLSLPEYYLQVAKGQVSQGARTALLKSFEDDTPLTRGVSMKMGVQQGLGVRGDTSVLSKEFLGFMEDQGRTGAGARAVDALAAVRRFSNRGIFQNLYPASVAWHFKNVSLPTMASLHPELAGEELAYAAAQATNKAMSSLPNWQQALGQPAMKTLAQSALFSTSRFESGVRSAASAFVGKDKRFWLDHWSGVLLYSAAMAELTHKAATGEWLPTSRFSPVDTTNGIRYNTDWLSPDTGMKGLYGQPVKADVIGQAEVPWKMLVDPLGTLSARENILPRAVSNQIAGRSFQGVNLTSTKPGIEGVAETFRNRLLQGAVDIGSPIGGEALGEAARQTFPATQPYIPQGKKNLGVAANLVQATGINLRADNLRKMWQKDTADYFALPSNPRDAQANENTTRNRYRGQHPDVDAKLFLSGQGVTTVRTQAAREEVVRLMRQYGLTPAEVKSIQEKPYESRARTGLRNFLLAQSGAPAPQPAAPTERRRRLLEAVR